MARERASHVEDLRGCSFDQFVAWAFDRPVAAEGETSWFHFPQWDEVELLVDPELQLTHASRLFWEPAFLLERFTQAQLDQGFFMLAFDCHSVPLFFSAQLWNRRIALHLRCACVSAMFDLYARLFAANPLGTSSYMWWDLLDGGRTETSPGASVGEDPLPDAEDEPVRRAMVDTLARILALPQRHCQEAALHGLSHLAMAGEREPLVDQFLTAHPALDAKLHDYALACRKGGAL